ncbi:hypothetical protein JG688_00018223 [Phytophthora aleatoria]|uniref:Uncharacterized protein n=1 Tax=Phytophthora aleatoria TaxID=2496075 RepID=A0A8J5MB98_9STRA|nr:hypothetical protein JG688_00018223 [Phytophthora aleatoria]
MASAASTVTATEPDIGSEAIQSPQDHIHASRAVIVRAPRIKKKTFDSWESFFACLHSYEDATHQVFKRRTSTSSKARSAELQQRGKATPPH